MSETTTPTDGTTEPEAPAYVPSHVLSSEPEPQPEPGPDAPAEAEPETPEPPKPAEKTPEEKAREQLNRRLGQIQAQRYAEKARADELEARLRRYETPAAPGEAPRPEDLPRLIEERAAELRAKERTEERVQSFHEAGRAAFPDWAERCKNLMEMGADAQMAELLIETPDGARVTAALADDPEELERIAGLKTERARAIALGHYAAAIATKPAPPPVPVPVSRAPAPIQPPAFGRARGEPDPNGGMDEYMKWSAKQNWDRR